MKYSVDYAEGFLEGMGFVVTDDDGKPISTRKILKDVIDNVELGCTEKVLDCICTDKFLEKHPIN